MAASRWFIYTLLILLRFYGAYYNSLPGYIHPDEFFQGGQELFFGCQQRQQQLHYLKKPTLDKVELSREEEHKHYESNKYVVDNIPWEFEPKNAIRSIVPPAFMTLLPLRVYSVLRSIITSSSNDGSIDCPSSVDNDAIVGQLSGSEILIIPRLFMTFLSMIFLDGCLWILVKYTTSAKDTTTNKKQSSRNSGPPIQVIVLASSWPILVMATRPFTNTLEAMVVSLLLLIVAMDHHHHHSISNKNSNNKISNQSTIPLWIGMICSIGLFARFTFAFFALPIVLLFLYNRWRASDNCWRNVGWNLFSLALSFLTTSLLFVTIDWYYYHYHSPGRDVDATICSDWSCRFVATASKYVVPWNAFRYNSKATNLAEHGLHPRITHALVNMPMMFGPLSLFGYFSCIETRKEYASSSAEACFRRVLCQSTIITGLVVLSCAPHQEPRFILPCIVPLVFLYGQRVVGMDNKQPNLKKRAILTTLWVVFNSILYLFFGWLHQGGLIPSLLHLPLPVNSQEASPEIVIYYKTYMPPTFLIRGRSLENMACNANDERRRVSCERGISLACDNPIIIDLQGSEVDDLLEVLHERLPCHHRNEQSVLLITPAPVMISLSEKNWREYKFLSVHGHRTHVSTEDWPVFNGTFRSFFDQLELVTYHVSCTADV
eukprot:scaffold39087_cov174-Skeletonema_marinoi.AAC.2